MRFHLTYDDLACDRQRAWNAWLRRHGIDPNLVAVPGWIEINERAKRVRYWGLRCDRKGKFLAHEAITVRLEDSILPPPVTDYSTPAVTGTLRDQAINALAHYLNGSSMYCESHLYISAARIIDNLDRDAVIQTGIDLEE